MRPCLAAACRLMPAAMICLLMAGLVCAQGQEDPSDLFELRIRPALAGVCGRCHTGEEPAGELRLDSRQALLAGGSRGPAVVPGQPAESLLLSAIRRQDPALSMPPEGNAPLDALTVAAFEQWIAAGAPWPQTQAPDVHSRHWAFEPLREAEPPADADWSAHPIDRFVAAGHRRHGLRPVPAADRRTLLRRVTFDLTGLPPTLEEIEAFLADESHAAWEHVIERLLASPRYGERWGRHWMDVVRYADTAGDNADYPIPEVRLYRDYIIDSFNLDLPFDRFVREQLAGDLLADPARPEDYARQLAATGFVALSRRYLTAPYEQHHLTIEETIDTLGKAFLGLTLRCARCHDHKFDPITTHDYYALYGIFASTQYPWAGGEEFHSKRIPRLHFVSLLPQEHPQWGLGMARQQQLEQEKAALEADSPPARKLAELGSQMAELEVQLQAAEQAGDAVDELAARLAALREAREQAAAELAALVAPLAAELEVVRRRGLPPGVPGVYAVGEAQPQDAAVHVRGDPANLGEVVPRGVPQALPGGGPLPIPAGASGRRELAAWLTGPAQPLVARVIVNRVWQHHFGRGLVATASNFGRTGSPPTHPELLDWLARDFIQGGWSIKRLHRLILTSQTYQLASSDDAACAAKDPQNALLWHYQRRRLEAEPLRDAMLFVAGRLDLARPGEHPFPPISHWNWTQHQPFKAVYDSQHRSVYLMTQRIQRHPFLALFDGPDTNTSTDERTRANVPLQALYLMNNPFVSEQAAAFAARLLNEPDPQARLVLGCTLAWGRPPLAAEAERATAFLQQYIEHAQRGGLPAGESERAAWTGLARVLLASSQFVYVE